MSKPLIAIIRGGFTGESVISMQSADRMMQAVDRDRFDPAFVTVGRDVWSAEAPDGTSLLLDRGTLTISGRKADGALIAIHGPPGEDGKLQGFLDVAGIPYQTGDVLNMALTFSKHATVSTLRQAGFPVAPSVLMDQAGMPADGKALNDMIAQTGLPCFVKPDQSGSSLGISKVNRAEALGAALQKAFKESELVMVEGALQGREFTCGVLRMKDRAIALPVCEIRTTREFFDYHAKYHDPATEEIIPAPLPDEVTRLIQARSVAIFNTLRCRGMARVDHIWDGKEVFTIEVNTTPGFSGASIYPKMLEVSGIGVAAAVNGLIEEMVKS